MINTYILEAFSDGNKHCPVPSFSQYFYPSTGPMASDKISTDESSLIIYVGPTDNHKRQF
jgi:hypothetical protein